MEARLETRFFGRFLGMSFMGLGGVLSAAVSVVSNRRCASASVYVSGSATGLRFVSRLIYMAPQLQIRLSQKWLRSERSAPLEADPILQLEESHYIDLKSIDVEPAKLSEFVSAFANTAGGELFIGIDEIGIGGQKGRSWRGFRDIEAANAHLAVIDGMMPLGDHYRATFLLSQGRPGAVLHLLVFKTKDILTATNGTPYIRRGAQKLPVKGNDALHRLRLTKAFSRLRTTRSMRHPMWSRTQQRC